MSTMPYFYTTVPESGTITLPEEFRGNQVDITVRRKSGPLPNNSDDFWRKKPLDEIVAEQGGPKICTNPDEYFGFLSELWDSKEEVEEFLLKRKDEI